jgi:predicted CoA-binding protein
MADWHALLVDDDPGLAAIFRESKTVAVLGAKADSAEPAYYVPAYLYSRGYRIRPVNPRFAGRRLHDAETVPSLRDLAEPADVIEVFRRPEYLPGHADEILALPPRSSRGPGFTWSRIAA